jgi:hypothetical protein
MGRFGLAAAVAFVATVALVSNANAVPSFVRQTGLTCNQCHITQLGTPDFTFTGKKFRLNGYRAPYVAEKIEAGEEGALNGRRLMLTAALSPLSFRIGQQLLAQSKPASLVGGPASVASSVTNRPFSNFSMFYVGGIGDHIGFWNEIYFDAAGSNGSSQTFRVMGMDEWDLKLVFNPGVDNIVGIATTSQTFTYLAGFGPANSGAAGGGALQRGGVGQAHTPYGNIAAYAMLKDRFLMIAGVQGGEDNYSLEGINYLALVGLAINNSDYNQIWWHADVKAGNDAIPIVTNTGLSADRNSFTYTDAISGVSTTRGAAPANVAYRATDIGDFIRSKTEIEFSFVDRGQHSLWSSCGVAMNRETYDDGAEIKQTGVGCNVRYLYNRTVGFNYGVSRFLKQEFTDRNGLVHPISQAKWSPISGTFHYKAAQNFRVSLGFGLAQSAGGNRLDDTRVYNSDGWNWSVGLDFLF